jgi:TPR repeat protein
MTLDAKMGRRRMIGSQMLANPQRRPSPARRSGAWRAFVLASLASILGLDCARADSMAAGERAYTRHDYARSAQFLLPEARRGAPKAQTYLGFMYENGFGVPQDYVEAAKWLRLAADQGAPTAQFLLGQLYDRGLGVKRDFVEAEVWLELAAANAEPARRDYWADMRDAVAGKLTQAELAEAQRRSAQWAPPAQR